jgi:hypothetical protein
MRSGQFIADAEARCNLHINTYNEHRRAMISLGLVDEHDSNSQFPPLEIKDTFMKSTVQKRQLGDSRRTDGMLWSFPAQNTLPTSTATPRSALTGIAESSMGATLEPQPGLSSTASSSSIISDPCFNPEIGTQMSRRKQR